MADNRGTVLVVDDDSGSLALLTSILTGAGYRVRPADSGELALASVDAVRPDLILLDMRMPGMDGIEICRRLKAAESTWSIPVIFISAFSDTADRVRGLALGAVDYVSKPFDAVELLARVRTHLELAFLHSQLEAQVATRTRELSHAVQNLLSEIEQRERTERALRESEGRFRQMANTAPVMIAVASPDQQVTFLNKGWLDFTGRTQDQELGTGWVAGIHPDDRTHVLAKISASFAARGPCNVEYRLRRADGEYRFVTCSGVPRFEPDGAFAGYVASLVDVSDLKRSNEEALARQKLESLGVLAGGIAHDFNNLLGSILADSELLLAELPETSPARESVERIEAVALRASEIVRQLMVYAGQESAVLEPVDLAAVVREMLGLMKVSISKNASLKTDLPRNLPPIQGNAAQIRQVVMNLITNASDALAGKQGVITVSLSQRPSSPESSADQGAGVPGGDFLRLEVADTGSGMSSKTQARIFEPFFSTKRMGRGLGLAAVQGIIRSHGGTINVVSSPGKGSRFEILLPCTAAPPHAIPATAPAAPPNETAGVTGTVLLIEDEDTLRLAAAKMLRRQGFIVFEAADGHAGLRLFRDQNVRIDLALLDLTLPGVSGRTVLHEMRKIRPNLNVILTTAYGPDRALAAVGSAESLQYLRKPYQLADLVEMVRRALMKKPRASGSGG